MNADQLRVWHIYKSTEYLLPLTVTEAKKVLIVKFYYQLVYNI